MGDLAVHGKIVAHDGVHGTFHPPPTLAPTLSQAPTPSPTEVPTKLPIPAPTELPIPAPTELPIPAPTKLPIPAPTELPIPAPTELPIPAPTELPIPAPTANCYVWADFGSDGDINSAADLTTYGWTYYANRFNEGSYYTSTDVLQFYTSNTPVGWIEKALPSNGNYAIVDWGASFNGGGAELYVGGTLQASVDDPGSRTAANLVTTVVPYSFGDVIRISEQSVTSVALIDQILICTSVSSEPTPAPTECSWSYENDNIWDANSLTSGSDIDCTITQTVNIGCGYQAQLYGFDHTREYMDGFGINAASSCGMSPNVTVINLEASSCYELDFYAVTVGSFDLHALLKTFYANKAYR